MSQTLKNLESLLYRLITAPSGVAEGLASERLAGGLTTIIAGDEHLSSEDRVAIYANMYFYRLLEVLKQDFPATAAVLGDTHFHNLVTGYLLEYPPTESSITWAGLHLSAYLRDHPLLSEFPYASDLATLERATIDVFCAADVPVLEQSEMGSIAPDRWAKIRMRRIAACTILDSRWRVASVLRAVEEQRDWTPPSREPNHILIWRRHSRVAYREIDDREAAALKMLDRPIAFGNVCEVLAGNLDSVEAPNHISSTLARWLNDGLLSRASRGKAR